MIDIRQMLISNSIIITIRSSISTNNLKYIEKRQQQFQREHTIHQCIHQKLIRNVAR